MVCILSDWHPTDSATQSSLSPATEGRTRNTATNINQRRGDQIDQGIADKATDKNQPDAKKYQWWSKNFHFTTDNKGEILQSRDGNTDIGNPIKMFPFVNFAEEQDGNFWAQGGSDLTDGGIKLNCFLTNTIHIAVQQGYGQLVMTGKGLPKSVKVGPNHAIVLETPEGDTGNSTAAFINANAPLSELLETLKTHVALLLTTNNLSTSGISASLDGSIGAASGISLIIDKSESMEDISDQQQIFRDREPDIWKVFYRWIEVYRKQNLLIEKWEKCLVISDTDLDQMVLDFPEPRPIMSEAEKLDILAKRKDLKLDTRIEMLMRDNPSLTEKTAQAKIDRIEAESQANMAKMQAAFGTPKPADDKPDDDNKPDELKDDDGDKETDDKQVEGE